MQSRQPLQSTRQILQHPVITSETIALLGSLQIPFQDPSSVIGSAKSAAYSSGNEANMNASLDLILHILECAAALQQVNGIIPPEQV